MEKNKDLALKAIELNPNYADAYAWAGLFSLWMELNSAWEIERDFSCSYGGITFY